MYTGSAVPIDCMDDDPSLARFQRRLASFSRLLRFDRLGSGVVRSRAAIDPSNTRSRKSAQPAAKKALSEIWGAEDKDRAHAAIGAFDKAYSAKFPKAVKKVTDDEDVPLAF